MRTEGQTDRHDEANSRFSQVRERTSKWTMLTERSHIVELSSSKSHTKDGKELREKRITLDKRI